jgi:hypothetical protein
MVPAVGAATASADVSGAVQDLPACTTNTLPANDDGSTGLVDIGFELNLNGNAFTQLYVNNNGNVTFDGPIGTFTPFDFTATDNPIIAPFFADVDTRGAGSAPVTYGTGTMDDGTKYFCVNWVNVGYYSSQFDKLNSAQLVIVNRGANGDADLVFNYDTVNWETGSASGGTNGFGGTPAAVGYSSGNGDPGAAFMMPGSFQTMALEDSNPTTGLVHNSRGSGQLGRYVFEVRNVPETGGRITGTVHDAGGGTVANAPVEVCPDSGDPCVTRTTSTAGVYRATNLPPGDYTITAHPIDESETPATGHATVVEGATATVDITLGPGPGAPPAGTTISSVDTTPAGIPVVYWTDPLTLTTQGCPGGTGSFTITVDGTVVRSGALTEDPDHPGTYVGHADPVYPAHGNATVHMTIDCGADPPQDVDFNIYIDPSGLVRDSNGVPIEGATVTLLRSSSAGGPFVQVPDGSALMSPSNRVNPDLTAADGSFGWDVVAGYYVVTAQKTGCVSAADHGNPVASSAVMQIPPPVTNLDIRLYCGGEIVTPPAPGPGTGGSANTPKPATATSVPPVVTGAASGAGPGGATQGSGHNPAPAARVAVSARRARLHRGHRTAVVRTRITIDQPAKLTLKIVDRRTKRAVTLRRGSKAGPARLHHRARTLSANLATGTTPAVLKVRNRAIRRHHRYQLRIIDASGTPTVVRTLSITSKR